MAHRFQEEAAAEECGKEGQPSLLDSLARWFALRPGRGDEQTQ